MRLFVGLDVSLAKTAICVISEHGKVVKEAQIASEPEVLLRWIGEQDGSIATIGVNMTKLESYMVDGVFSATQFYADIEGHPDDANAQRALEELDYFTSSMTLLGVYPADPMRH